MDETEREIKNCDACGSQLGEMESGSGVYKCIYYPGHFSKKIRGAYIKNIYPRDAEDEYNVMLCCSCQDKNKGHFDIPDHIPKEQYEKWLWLRLKER